MLDPPDDPIAGAYRLLPPQFAAEVTNDDGTAVFRLQGELDMATAPGLDTAVSTILATGPSAIALDLSELTFVDSTGLHVFVVPPAGRPGSAARSSFASPDLPCSRRSA